MPINSKIDLRLEAARLVLQLPGTTVDNFHERAYRVELYLLGDANIPEQESAFNDLLGVIQEAGGMLKKEARSNIPVAGAGIGAIGPCTGIGDAELLNKVADSFCHSPHGIPSSEGEAIFLQRDGEKVE